MASGGLPPGSRMSVFTANPIVAEHHHEEEEEEEEEED
jgi:hypothetical protein